MDTITHGIAGALISKAMFHGDDLFAMRALNRRRIVTWSTMLGAIFPDSDTFRDMLSHNDMLVITWHRSITHSLLFLPVFALVLAALTRWIVRWRKWDAPSFSALTGIYAVGILSHILLDLVTSFGTMIWSPLAWTRPAWDLIFIVDFTFTGILLAPQILAWVHERPEKSRRRALVSLAIFILAVFAVQSIGNAVGAPISSATVFLFDVILAALFLFPLQSKKKIPAPTKGKPAQSAAAKVSEPDAKASKFFSPLLWNRAGLACACVYIALAIVAHHAALDRVRNFATQQKLEVQTLGALPFPPSLWRWDGLVRTPRGVYELRLDLSQKSAFENSTQNSKSQNFLSQPSAPGNSASENSAQESSALKNSALKDSAMEDATLKNSTSANGAEAEAAERPVVEYRFYPEAHPNVYIEAAKGLPAVQKVLWFDRFPVTRYHEEHGEPVVEFSDMRFPQVRRGLPAPFTYRVRFGPGGNVISQGWAK
jgi:membrane-bound metal-dependent hydrolase YbcI (DUF457 family)